MALFSPHTLGFAKIKKYKQGIILAEKLKNRLGKKN